MERCQTQGNYNFDDDRQRKLTPYPGGSTLTGMDTMMVGWWVRVGNSHVVQMH